MLTRYSFRQYILSSDWYKPQLKVLIACSGGIDSTVLLHLLSDIPNLGISIVHFNHQLRGAESDKDAEFVQELGSNHGVQVHMISEDIQAYAESNGLSLEEAGSLRRRTTFQTLMEDLDYDFIASGQHMDDQIETILMNIYLGTGLQGLTGISECAQNYIRPLLNHTRREILLYSEKHKLGYRTDGSNMDISFLRNNFRANVIPTLGNNIDERLRSTIEGIFRENQSLNQLVETSVEDIDIKGFRVDYAPKIALGLRGLPDYFSPIQKAIFDRAFQSISLMPQGISSKHFDALKSLFSDNSIGKEMQLPGSVTAFRDRGGITLFKRSDYQWSTGLLPDSGSVKYPFFQVEYTTSFLEDNVQDPAYFWDLDGLDSYIIRVAKSGDKMIVDTFGRALPVYQIMQSARVAPHLKEFYPIVEHQGKVIWVPGIRTAPSHMISEEIIRENRSKHCMKVEFQKGTFE